jgi:polysaccharide biosynthesis protein PslG
MKKTILVILLLIFAVSPVEARWRFPTRTPTPTIKPTPTPTTKPTPTFIPIPTLTPIPTPIATLSIRINPICVCSHLNSYNNATIDKNISLMKQAGVYWIRTDFSWGQIETSLNTYNFTVYDYIVNKAIANGMQVLALIPQYDIPTWRNGNNDWQYPPTSPQEYGDFVKKVAEHFKGRIMLYEIGNEQNGSWFTPNPSAIDYMNLLKASYPLIKQVDSNAKVISGGLSPSSQTFLTAMYQNGLKGNADYIGYHPYSWPASPDFIEYPETFSEIAEMRTIAQSFGDNSPFMATEVGWPTYTGGVSESTQANYINRVFKKIMIEDYQYVQVACIYDFIDDGTNKSDPENNFGILRYNYVKKPAFNIILNNSQYFNQYFSQINP